MRLSDPPLESCTNGDAVRIKALISALFYSLPLQTESYKAPLLPLSSSLSLCGAERAGGACSQPHLQLNSVRFHSLLLTITLWPFPLGCNTVRTGYNGSLCAPHLCIFYPATAVSTGRDGQERNVALLCAGRGSSGETRPLSLSSSAAALVRLVAIQDACMVL